jgi:hypothetical protein
MPYDEIEKYCGNCGLQVEKDRGNCPYCGAPLNVTLVSISRREREWTNPDRWQIGRKGWIRALFEKRFFPSYEEWLYNTKHKSKGELSPDEVKQTVAEHGKFIEERRKERKSWKISKIGSGKHDDAQRALDKPDMSGFDFPDTIESLLEEEKGQITIKGNYHSLGLEDEELSNIAQAHIEILSADPKTGSSTLIRLHTSQAELLYELLGIKLRQARDWHNIVVKPLLDKYIARTREELREKEGQKDEEK